MSLIPTALAASNGAGTQTAHGNPMGSLLILIVFVLVFYFLLWRPQSKRAKEHRELIAQLAVGDEVITAGGMLGRITQLDDDFLTIEIANSVQIKVQRNSVSTSVPKGTFKAAN